VQGDTLLVPVTTTAAAAASVATASDGTTAVARSLRGVALQIALTANASAPLTIGSSSTSSSRKSGDSAKQKAAAAQWQHAKRGSGAVSSAVQVSNQSILCLLSLYCSDAVVCVLLYR
jgi:hypothetical protein